MTTSTILRGTFIRSPFAALLAELVNNLVCLVNVLLPRNLLLLIEKQVLLRLLLIIRLFKRCLRIKSKHHNCQSKKKVRWEKERGTDLLERRLCCRKVLFQLANLSTLLYQVIPKIVIGQLGDRGGDLALQQQGNQK